MILKKISKQEKEAAAKLLFTYWKKRGMPQYNLKWAKEYLNEGHKKEIKRDEFFVYKDGKDIIGIISLITDVSNVAEIRDMIVLSKYKNEKYSHKMLNAIIKYARKRKIRKLYSLIFPKSKELFTSFGFRKEGILRSHFSSGEDLTIMGKFL